MTKGTYLVFADYNGMRFQVGAPDGYPKAMVAVAIAKHQFAIRAKRYKRGAKPRVVVCRVLSCFEMTTTPPTTTPPTNHP